MSLRNALPLLVNGTMFHHDCGRFGYFSKVHKVFICVQSVIIFLIISTNVMSNKLIIALMLR